MLSTSFSRPARSINTNSTTSLNWFLISQHLHSKSSNELRNIIKHMVSQVPELAELIVTPSPPTPRHESKSVFAVGGTTGEIDSEDSDMEMSQNQHQHAPNTTTHSDPNASLPSFSNTPTLSVSYQFSSATPASGFGSGSPLVVGRKRKASAFHDHSQPSFSFSPVQSPSQSQKRHRGRDTSYGELAVCANCQAVFGSERYGLHECVYHPGHVVGHVWSCCGQQGNVGGCLRTRHTDPKGVGSGVVGMSSCGFEADAWSGQRLLGDSFGDSAMVES